MGISITEFIKVYLYEPRITGQKRVQKGVVTTL